MIEKLPKEIYAVLGEGFQVTCTAKNDQDAPINLMFSWNKPKDVQINITDGDEDSRRNASSTITITNVTKNYEGKYKCTVKNRGSVSTSFSLIVEGIYGVIV